MTQGQTLAAGLVLEPFLMTLMRTFIGVVSVNDENQLMDVDAGYLRVVSGGTSMTHGHTLAVAFTPPLATTLMFSFMTRDSL